MIFVAATSDHSHTSSVPPAFIRTTRLKFFGHTARADPSMDPSQALWACVAPLPRDWNRRSGRLRHTWLRTVESDLAPLNIGLATAYDFSAESSSLEHARRNGSVQHRTSHTMMMMLLGRITVLRT